MISSLDAEVTRIEIHDLHEGTFFARILLRAEGRDLVVDARPSDAIGVAVRAVCPVFIAESVVEEPEFRSNLVAGLQVGEEHLSSPDSESVPDTLSQEIAPVAPASRKSEIEQLRAELERRDNRREL